jgi:hypothetical protein
MSGKWMSIERPPCGRAFAVSVASWAMAMPRTMDSPAPQMPLVMGAWQVLGLKRQP